MKWERKKREGRERDEMREEMEQGGRERWD
jgi:hypothetical protein